MPETVYSGIITADELIERGWACKPEGSTLGEVSLHCIWDEGEPIEGDNEYSFDASISFEGTALVMKDEFETRKLHLCSTSDYATM